MVGWLGGCVLGKKRGYFELKVKGKGKGKGKERRATAGESERR